MAKVRSIVMSGDDESIGIDRAPVAAGRDLQLRIVPIAQDRQPQVQGRISRRPIES